MNKALRPPAAYFPIAQESFAMSAGLFRLGSDFGNGAVDRHFFQRDALAPVYRAEKERVLATRPDRLSETENPGTVRLKRRIFEWMCAQLREEHQLEPDNGGVQSGSEFLAGFKRLSLCIQEDFAVLSESDDGEGSLDLLSVCFPSGWRPETLLGKGFQRIHSPVPGFESLNKQSSRLVRAMIHRGPYVRFVWSLTADARLDHHPDHAPRDPWRSDSEGYLRVERQVTVPFPEVGGSLFLIRTYVYPLTQLSAEQRDVLFEATEALPESIRTYKGLAPETIAVVARAAGREVRADQSLSST